MGQIIRAKVANTGKRVAKDVRAQITHVWLKPNPISSSTGKEWVVIIDMPIWLSWASRDHAGSIDAERIDLASGMVDYLPISYKVQTDGLEDGVHWPLERGEQLRSDSLVERFAKIGEYRFEVTVFSDNTEPITSVVAYKLTASNKQVVDLKQSTAPLVAPPPAPGDLKDALKGPVPDST